MFLFSIFSRAKKIAGFDRSSSNKPEMHKNDIISNLPDEILECLMMNVLSKEEAARMAAVSRRWKNLWADTIVYAPRFNFCEKRKFRNADELPGESDTKEYIERVNKFIKLHRRPTLEEFTIGFTLSSKFSDHIDKWLEFASQKGVKKLKLEFDIVSGNPLRPHYEATVFAKLPMHFLRDLYLSRVNLSDEVMECLISNSPFLETLFVRCSDLLHELKIASPKLKCLDMRFCPNLQSLKISAPNLNTFRFYSMNEILVHVDIVTAPHLSQVTLGCFIDHGMFDWFIELLAYFSQLVKELVLDLASQVFWYISCYQCPQLTKVEILKILVRSWGTVQLPSSSSILLKAAPLLHSLSIKLLLGEIYTLVSPITYLKWMDEHILNKAKADVHHSHPNLKEVELVGFSGVGDEVELVLNLLEIAVSLEKIIIRVYIPPESYKSLSFIYERLSWFSKASREFVQLFITHIRPQISVVVI